MNKKKEIIGMVHVPALPGTPGYDGNMDAIIRKCVHDAKLLEAFGFTGLMIENMHDVPYLKGAVGPEIVASMTMVAQAIKSKVDIPLGIQILAGANKEALSVAHAAGLDFIRTEGFVFGHIGDEGYHDSCAAELLRYRKQIGAEKVKVFTDIKKKHSSHSITQDVSLAEMAKAARFFLSDGIIITGVATGEPVDLEALSTVRNVGVPVFVGSGITAENLRLYYSLADGFIVGSYMKEEGLWSNPLSETRIGQLFEAIQTLNK